MAFVKALLQPPMRLRALPDRWAKWLRALWILLFGLSVLTVVVSTIYAVRASYWIQPDTSTSSTWISTSRPTASWSSARLPGRQPAIPVTAKVIAIDGKPVPPDLQVARLRRTPRQRARADGRRDPPRSGRPLARADPEPQQDRPDSPAEARERDLRIWTRLLTGLLACTALLACSLLLALRRPNDPVAMLLAFAFVGIAATIDPPLQFWLWTDQDIVLDCHRSRPFLCPADRPRGLP